MPQEYVDYLLIKHLYHCTPSELAKQDQQVVDMHVAFMNIEAEEDRLQQKRAQQRSKQK